MNKRTTSSSLFRPGRNLAMKIAPKHYPATVSFYEDVLGLGRVADHGEQHVYEFSGMRLWLDEVPGQARTELWLEVCSDDLPAADACLAAAGIHRCDEVEALPKGFQGFWIRNPAGLVHLVCAED